jgi:hypothetical protein
MALDVRVQRPIVYDDALVEVVLGEVALPLGHADCVLAPFITINGRIHGLTSNFLRHHCLAKPELGTVSRVASDLVGCPVLRPRQLLAESFLRWDFA